MYLKTRKNPVAFLLCLKTVVFFPQVGSVFITSENVSRPSYSIWLQSIIPKQTATYMSPWKQIGRNPRFLFLRKLSQRRNGLDIAVIQGALSALPVENFIACLLCWNLSLTLPTASQDVDFVSPCPFHSSLFYFFSCQDSRVLFACLQYASFVIFFQHGFLLVPSRLSGHCQRW